MAKKQFIIDNLQSDIDFECDNIFIARTLQNAKNLLMCRVGEVPYMRVMGFRPELLALPMDELREVLMEELDRVMIFEPNVEVVAAEAFLNEDHETVIRCRLEIDTGDDD